MPVHSIITTDGSYRQSKFLRTMRSVSYVLFALAGAALLLSDILIDYYGLTSQVMAWFLLFGGLSSASGSLSRMWVGEFIGLPLLSTALLVLGIEVWAGGNRSAPFIEWGNLLILAGMAALVTARWWMVVHVYRAARAITEIENRQV